MKVLLTGHRGFIGANLVKLLKDEGHFVSGVDAMLFDGCEWDTLTIPDKEIRKDIRQLTVSDLEGYDCVIHLAAISNDPMGDLDPEITYSVNRDGSVYLAQIAKKVGVPRFLFASSCSMYGQGETLDLDETAILNPLTAYAKSKVAAEEQIKILADNNFCPVFLRNATSYGYSPMLRIDLVVNNLLACAFVNDDIRIMSDGTPWRPLIHCKDIARAFIAFMKTSRDKIYAKSINIGANNENYQVQDIASKISKVIPSARVVYTGEIGHDPRNYRVNFDLLNQILPDFKLEYSLDKGIEELHQKLIDNEFNLGDFEGYKFVRLRALKKTISSINESSFEKKI